MDIEQQYDKLLRYCYMKLRDRSLAEDITQESFTRFLESRSYRDTGKDMAYLYTIARNLCTDYFRRCKPKLFGDTPPEPPDAPDATPELTERLAIERALDMLAPEDREIVVLRYIAEFSAAEIGTTLGMSRFAVHRRLTAALGKLRKELEEA